MTANTRRHTHTHTQVRICSNKYLETKSRSSLLTSDLQVHGAVHGQGQGQEVEGVEASADVSARLALDLGLELTVEQVHHDGAVPTQVVLPRLSEHTEHKQNISGRLFSSALSERTPRGGAHYLLLGGRQILC